MRFKIEFIYWHSIEINMTIINEYTKNMEKIAEQHVNKYYSNYDKEDRVWSDEVPMVKEAVISLLTEKNIIEYVRNFSGSNGFMFSSGPEISRIHDLWHHQGHSGASAGCCLRMCQFIFKQMFDENINLIV